MANKNNRGQCAVEISVLMTFILIGMLVFFQGKDRKHKIKGVTLDSFAQDVRTYLDSATLSKEKRL